MLKRCFSALLAFCMLLTLAPSMAFAGADVLAVSQASVDEGDTDTVIPITIEKQGGVGVASLQFDVVFPDALILTAKPTVGTLFADKGLHSDTLTSPYTISLGNDTATEDTTDEGVLVTLNFTVKAGTPAGDYEIKIEEQDNYTASIDSVEFLPKAGKITVSPSSNPLPTPEPIPVTYAATPAEGGGVGGPETVLPGETLEVAATPATGYKLTALTANGTSIISDGKYKVPADATAVKVEATFEAEAAEEPADESYLEVGQANGKAGETVEITIEKHGGKGVSSLQFDVVFPDELTLTAKPTVGTLFADKGLHSDTLTSPYTISLGNDTATEDTTDEGTLVTLKFQIKAGTEPDEYPITIAAQDNYTAAIDSVEFAVKDGKVIVSPSSNPDPDPISVTYAASPKAGGSVSGAETVLPGETLEVTAEAADGYKLTALTANGTSIISDGKYEVPADATAVKVEATFEAEAAEEPTGESYLEVSQATGAPGETVDIMIEKVGSVGVASLQFDVVFPDELILTAKPEVGPLFADKGLHSDTLTSPYTISLGNDTATEDTTAEGTLLVLTFQIKAGTEPDEYPITIAAQDNYTAAIDSVEFAVKDGKVTVPGEFADEVMVTFDGNEGEPAFTLVTVAKGGTVNAPEEDPTREGYKFVGWFEDDDNDGRADKEVKFPVTVDENKTFYAMWEEVPETETVKVTFDGNGGTPESTPVTVAKGGQVNAPEEDPEFPDRHRFMGWFEDKDATKAVTFPVTVDKDTTFYAGWAEIAVLTFDANGGQINELYSVHYEVPEKGAQVDAPELTLTRDGYTFTGWFEDENATQAATFPVTADADKTFYAGWEEETNEVTVTFNGNGGKPASTPVTVEKGGTVDKPETDPTRNHYIFTGWFEDKDATQAATFPVTVDADKTFYAGWESDPDNPSKGCYIATSVYGSYDCPQVWTLRRFRDDVLGQTWYGRLFIKAYYAISPTLVRLFGETEWFQDFWREKLDTLVETLQDDGFASTPYQDQDW